MFIGISLGKSSEGKKNISNTEKICIKILGIFQLTLMLKSIDFRAILCRKMSKFKCFIHVQAFLKFVPSDTLKLSQKYANFLLLTYFDKVS